MSIPTKVVYIGAKNAMLIHSFMKFTPARAESRMATISMNFYRDLNCAHEGQHEAVKPVIITSLTKAGAPSKMPNATQNIDTIAATLEYKVSCPNCARVEFASTVDLFKHRCNCGYGVYVEMLQTSPN
jgi:hypothetical protein